MGEFQWEKNKHKIKFQRGQNFVKLGFQESLRLLITSRCRHQPVPNLEFSQNCPDSIQVLHSMHIVNGVDHE